MARRRRLGALGCEPAIAVDELPSVPLFPGQRQNWVVVARNDTPEMGEQLLRAWQQIIPGDVGPAEVSSEVDATNLAGEPPPLTTRSESVFTLSFDYHGTDTFMRWPTFVLRRRERIDPTCPTAEVDAIVTTVNPPSNLANDGILPADRNPLRDPLDVGLPQLPPVSKITGFLKVAIPGALIAVGVGFVALELWRGRKGSP